MDRSDRQIRVLIALLLCVFSFILFSRIWTNSETVSFSAGSISREEKVNINDASAEDLADRLDGIGSVLAQRIVEYREENGPFRTVEELLEVQGIGEARLEAIRQQIDL